MGSNFDFRPMEPIVWPEPFTEPDWIFQVKWDGVRMLGHWTGDAVRLLNRQGETKTEQYPEISELARLFPPDTVIDGELVVLTTGKPDFELILKRDQRRNPAAVKQGREQWPVTYAVFDLLYQQGRDLRTCPLLERQATLLRLWPGNCSHLHLVPNYQDGEKLYAATGSLGWEGIVAKRLQSSYLPGKKHSEWRKIKHWRYLNCVVGGYTLRTPQPSSLLLGVYQEGQLFYVGRASSGLDEASWQAIADYLAAAEVSTKPFVNPVPQPAGREVRWLEPLLAVEVKFMNWSQEGRLRAPIILKLLSASEVDCSLRGRESI